MVAGCKLTFGLGKVERATVGLGSTCDHVDYEGDNGGNVTFEDEPEILLLGNDAFNRHCAGKTYHGDYREADRELIADHLGSGAERTDEGKLVVR